MSFVDGLQFACAGILAVASANKLRMPSNRRVREIAPFLPASLLSIPMRRLGGLELLLAILIVLLPRAIAAVEVALVGCVFVIIALWRAVRDESTPCGCTGILALDSSGPGVELLRALSFVVAGLLMWMSPMVHGFAPALTAGFVVVVPWLGPIATRLALTAGFVRKIVGSRYAVRQVRNSRAYAGACKVAHLDPRSADVALGWGARDTVHFASQESPYLEAAFEICYARSGVTVVGRLARV